MICLKRHKHAHGLFYFFLLLLLLLCFIRYSLQINIPPAVLTVIASMAMLFGDPGDIVAMCICCIPMYTMFQYGYAVLFGLLCYSVKCGSRIRLNASVTPVILIVLWELIHCFGNDFVITQFLGFLPPLLLLTLLICSDGAGVEYAFIVRSFAIATAATCVIVLSRQLFTCGFDFFTLMANLRRLGMDTAEMQDQLRVIGGHINSNTLGVICVLVIAGIFQVRILGQCHKADIALILILLFFGAMTASRTFLVCLAIMVILLFLNMEKGRGKKARFIIGVVMIILTAYLLVLWITPLQLEVFYKRFLVEDTSGGRTRLMKVYNDFIASGKILLYGIGLHNFDLKLKDFGVYWVANAVPHNGIQEVIIAWGIVGLLLSGGVFLAMQSGAKRKHCSKTLLNYIPLLIIVAKVQVGQLITSPYTMMSLSYAYLSMRTDFSGNDIIQKGQNSNEFSALYKNKGINLWKFAKYVWKQRVMLTAIVLVGVTTSIVVTKTLITPMYESTVLLYVNGRNILASKENDFISADEIFVSRSQVNTQIEILQARETINRILDYADLNITYEEAKKMIRAYPEKDTEIMKIVIESANPHVAERLANALTVVLPERVDEIIDGISVKVVDYAVAATKTGLSNRTTNLMIGFMFSLVLGILCLLIQALQAHKIKEEDDIIDLFAYPILGSIPNLDE